MFDDVILFIRKLYPAKDMIALHEPVFSGNERKYVLDAIDSTFVSSVGAYVNSFEKKFADYVGANHAVVTSNGTLALHMALMLSDVQAEDEVLTQALTFVATANAIRYCGAHPVFIDSDPKNLGMSYESLRFFLETSTENVDGRCVNKKTRRVVRACVPMHVFGHPVEIDRIVELCAKHSVPVIEDAAESLGSRYKDRHTGLFGKISIFSFNGNKIVTSGGGGMIVTNDPDLAKRAKHLTTTAKIPHRWEFVHDEIGYNYRMPNLNAALACGQLERLDEFVNDKRRTAEMYRDFFAKKGMEFVSEPEHARSNYWLNAIMLNDRSERERFLQETNDRGVMTRPVWDLMPDLAMFKDCESVELPHARRIADRLVNIPSSVRVS